MSRSLLGAIGLWMVWRALRHAVHAHGDREGVAVGIMAGLIPCPLTLFVMTFAMIRSVPEAGIAFAVAMMAGVAFTLSAVALVTVFFRSQLISLLKSRPKLVAVVTRSVEAVAGAVLVAVALHEIL